MRIDAHHHFWMIERGDYGWLGPKLLPLYRDFQPRDLEPLLEKARIDKTILVQAAPTEAETRYILRLAEKAPFVAGVVGWTDFDARDVEKRIATLAENPLIVGLRPMLHDIKDEDWILRDELRPALAAMAKHGLVFDVLARPHLIHKVARVVRQWPEITFVVDHAAKPTFKAGVSRLWFEDMAALASLPNVYVKLSGLISEIGPSWEIDHMQGVSRLLLSEFGPQRVIWGSDWPVLNLAGDYMRWLAASEELLFSCTNAEREMIFGLNAARVYLGQRGRR